MKKILIISIAILCYCLNTSAQIYIDSIGNAGIGTPTPSATLDVEGTFQLKDSTQGASKVLISDSLGNASWQNINSTILFDTVPPLSYNNKLCLNNIGSLNVSGVSTAVAVQENYAYILNAGNGKLDVIDISNPTSPQPVGSISYGSGGVSPQSIVVQGNYAYVVDVVTDFLKVIDVSNPAVPSITGSLLIGGIDQFYSMAIEGNYAYVVDKISGDLTVINVSNPASPSLSGSVSIGTSPTSVTVQGNYAYVVDDGTDVLKVFDVSNPALPFLSGSLAIGANGSYLWLVAVQGNYAYVVGSQSNISANGFNSNMEVINISTPTNPSLIYNLVLGDGGGQQSLTLQGNYAYVVDDGTDELNVIDISNPAMPYVSGSLNLSSSYPGNLRIDVQDNYAYVQGWTSGFDTHLKVINLFCENQVGIVIDPATGSLNYQNLLWQRDTTVNSIFNIENNTKVGIGTNTPQYKLTVKTNGVGITQESDDGTVRIGTYAHNSFGAYLQTHSNHSLNFATNNSPAQLTLDTTGNVGIGTSTPDTKLDVELTNAEFNVLDSSDGTNVLLATRHTGLNNNNPQTRFEGMAANYTDVGQDVNGNFVVEQNNSAKLLVTPGGNVGLGTILPPAKKLVVNGNLKINGNLEVVSNNLLTVENFQANLTNSGDFTGSSSSTPINLKYTSIAQNTDPAIFSMNTSTGALTFLKAGVVKVSAQFDFIRNTAGYSLLVMRANGTNRNNSLASSDGDWQQVTGHMVWKVVAGDVLTLVAYPNRIDSMDNGTWSTLSVEWTGVK